MFPKYISEIQNAPRLISKMGFIVLFLIGGLTFWSAAEYVNSVRWRAQSHLVIGEIRSLNLAVHSALAHHRGYFLYPDQESLKNYAQAKDSVREDLYHLGLLVSDNPTQAKALESVSSQILSRMSQLEASLEELQQNNRRVALLMMEEDIRDAHNDETKYLISQMEEAEQKLLANREEEAKNHFIQICILVLAGLAIASLLFFSATNLWRKELTQRLQTEKDLKDSNKQIKRASDLKSSFLTNMSHEIRSPLNGIIGMTKLLEHTSLTPSQTDYVETIKTSSSALLALINDILDLSKIESGKFQLEEINFELASLIRSTISIVDFSAKTKNLKIRTEIDPDMPDFFVGDPLRLRQILLNLLNNAIKFSDQGEVLLRIHHKVLSENTVHLRFEIIDQGIGFDHETKERLFQGKYDGSGLGLSISKQIVEMMNGSIDAESIRGVGSKFFFTVPLRTVQMDSKRGPIISMSDLNHNLHGNVLIAEDNRMNQKVIAEMVELLGCRYQVVSNGEETITALGKDRFDLILMSGQMPVIDGYEAARMIREGKAGENNKLIPIIATSANAIKGDIERSLEAGMNDHLSKPTSYNDLSVKIEKWLRQDSAVIDESQLAKLRRQEALSGKILIPELVAMFIHDVPLSLRQMHYNLSQKNMKSLRSVAHDLKISGAILGAIRFKDIAERIERAPEDATEEQMTHLLNSLEREMNIAIEVLRHHRTDPLIDETRL